MEAVAETPAELHFTECLLNVLYFTDGQIHVLHDGGFVLAEDLAYWSYKEITTWVAHREKLRVNASGSPYGDMKMKSLCPCAEGCQDN